MTAMTTADAPAPTRPSSRRPLRLAGAVLAGFIALVYLLIATGVVTVLEGPAAEVRASQLIFGLTAAAFYTLGAVLLVRIDRRLLWTLGAALQVFVVVMYVSVGTEREPAFEFWGILLRLVQIALLVVLVLLAARAPARGGDIEPAGVPAAAQGAASAAPRVLIAYGSKMGGTAGIAGMLAETLRSHGLSVDEQPAAAVSDLSGYDAVLVGGALYALRWHRDARRFVRRHRKALKQRPVWLFSSGPLDDSATQRDIGPVRFVARAMRSLSARGHATFGGRIPADAQGFPASVIARGHAGDWRDAEQIAGWAHAIARELAPSPQLT